MYERASIHRDSQPAEWFPSVRRESKACWSAVLSVISVYLNERYANGREANAFKDLSLTRFAREHRGRRERIREEINLPGECMREHQFTGILSLPNGPHPSDEKVKTVCSAVLSVISVYSNERYTSAREITVN